MLYDIIPMHGRDRPLSLINISAGADSSQEVPTSESRNSCNIAMCNLKESEAF